MSNRNDPTQWTAEQTLSYINGLIAAQDNDKEEDNNQTLYTALSISYQYLTNATKRKITWSLSLEKLAYEFIELAFDTNMHSSIKDVFKSYRAITQGQYSQSLKYVLEHYRDKKLEVILEEDILESDLPLIRSLPSIQTEQPSPEIILDSLHPQLKQRQMQIRNKLKIVWEGYKSIVETVRVNQKLQDVYMATLNKIFDFVDRYNRVQQFKAFCRSLRTGLQTAFNKRDKSQQQKAIYIDIEKTDVNTRNIQIRMQQFKVTTKLGLWSQSFQVLEDINNLMKVRKSTLKNSLRCQYYQSLALLFSKNNFWHYHAFAFYNYYLAYLTKPKITLQQKARLADKLLLSILAIPKVTLESGQSKQIQDKICGMMITSTKVPSRNQLVQLMISKGVLENASGEVCQLWNFMFLQFGVSSLKKGLQLVTKLNGQNYGQFYQLIQATLINRQLISIAEVYQRIRISSLERLIPLPLQKIKKILIMAHRQKILDFTFDQNQGILIFQDHTQQINPTEEFHKIFVDVAIAYEMERKIDEVHIKRKAEEYINDAQNNIWNIRQYKIEEFKKKMKKPLLQMRKAGMLKDKQQREQKQRQEIQRKFKESEAIKKNEELQKILATKKIIINDIISIKEKRVIRIMDKKIENLTDEEIENLTIETLQLHLQATKKMIANNKQTRLKKAFTHIDYLQRQRRQRLIHKVKSKILPKQQQELVHATLLQTAKKSYDEHHKNQSNMQNLARYYKNKIEDQIKQVVNQYDKDLDDYKNRIKENFKEKIIAKARGLQEENQKKKQQQRKLQEEAQKSITDAEYQNGNWSFKKLQRTSAPAPVREQQKQAPISFKSNNIFEKLEDVRDRRQQEPRVEKPGGKWAIGSKKVVAEPQKQVAADQRINIERKQQKRQQKKPEKPKQQKKDVFVPPPINNPTAVEKKGKWVDDKPVEKKKQEIKPTQPEVKKGKRF